VDHAVDSGAVVVTRAGSGRYLSGYDRKQSVVDNLAALESAACDRATFNHGTSRIWIFRLHC
jgi:hypothetical protein